MLKIYLIVLLNFTLRKYKFFEFILFIFAQKFKINKHWNIIIFYFYYCQFDIFFLSNFVISVVVLNLHLVSKIQY